MTESDDRAPVEKAPPAPDAPAGADASGDAVPAPDAAPAPQEEVFQGVVYRRPRIGRFLVTGGLLGAAIGLIATAVAGWVFDEGTGSVGLALVVACALGTAGALAGGVAALWIQRRQSRRRVGQ